MEDVVKIGGVPPPPPPPHRFPYKVDLSSRSNSAWIASAEVHFRCSRVYVPPPRTFLKGYQRTRVGWGTQRTQRPVHPSPPFSFSSLRPWRPIDSGQACTTVRTVPGGPSCSHSNKLRRSVN